MKIWWIVLLVLLLIWIGRSIFSTYFIEKPKSIDSKKLENGVELRTLAPMIQASVLVSGDNQQQALGNGFRQLAGYIFGGNTTKQSVAMTSPVALSTESTSIAMTAPVASQQIDGQYRVAFMMPSSYTMETLPTAENKNIRFDQLPEQRFYIWAFGGSATETKAKKQLVRFEEALTKQGIVSGATPILNQYNDPRTIGFLRTNEWWIAVE